MHLAEKRHQYLRYIGTIKQGLSLIIVDDGLVRKAMLDLKKKDALS